MWQLFCDGYISSCVSLWERNRIVGRSAKGKGQSSTARYRNSSKKQPSKYVCDSTYTSLCFKILTDVAFSYWEENMGHIFFPAAAEKDISLIIWRALKNNSNFYHHYLFTVKISVENECKILTEMYLTLCLQFSVDSRQADTKCLENLIFTSSQKRQLECMGTFINPGQSDPRSNWTR